MSQWQEHRSLGKTKEPTHDAPVPPESHHRTSWGFPRTAPAAKATVIEGARDEDLFETSISYGTGYSGLPETLYPLPSEDEIGGPQRPRRSTAIKIGRRQRLENRYVDNHERQSESFPSKPIPIALPCTGDAEAQPSEQVSRWRRGVKIDASEININIGGYYKPAEAPGDQSLTGRMSIPPRSRPSTADDEIRSYNDYLHTAEQYREKADKAQQLRPRNGLWSSGKTLSPSPSQEPLRPTRPSQNFLIGEEDEADMRWPVRSSRTHDPRMDMERYTRISERSYPNSPGASRRRIVDPLDDEMGCLTKLLEPISIGRREIRRTDRGKHTDASKHSERHDEERDRHKARHSHATYGAISRVNAQQSSRRSR